MSGRKQTSGKKKVGKNKETKREGVVQLCYGGYFSNHSIDGPEYHEGKVIVERVSAEDVGISWLLVKVKDLGYSNVIKMHYRKGNSLKNYDGLVLLGDDLAEMRLRIFLSKYGAVTIYVEHGESDQMEYGGSVDVGQTLGVTNDEERCESFLVVGHLGATIIEGDAGSSYPQSEGQNSTFNQGQGSVPVSGVGVGAGAVPVEDEVEVLVRATSDLRFGESEIPSSQPSEFVQVPVVEEQPQRNDEKPRDSDSEDEVVEEIQTGEEATLLVEEVHFADSDSHDEELEIAREAVRKWRKRRSEARRYESSDSEGRGEEQQHEKDAGEAAEDDEGAASERDSVYHSSDSDWSVRTEEEVSDEEHDSAQRKPLHWPQYDPEQPFLDFCVRLGFSGPKEFKEALSRYALRKQVDYKLNRNGKYKVSAVCKGTAGEDGPRCPWRVYASWQTTDGVFRVKKYTNNHQCNPAYKNRRVTAAVIAKYFKNRIDENPSLKCWQLQRLVKTHMKTEVHLSKCIRAKRIHYEDTIKREKEEFGKLWSYVAELRESNPGNSVYVKTQRNEETGGNQFKRMYMCLSACRDGFLGGCRKFIGIDGCFLKGILKGELLTAIGMDANNQMYPIAWAVVEVENTESWSWFLRLLGEDLQLNDGSGWCVISDQQKGLMNAIQSVVPNIQQRMCCRHIYANWRKKHKGKDLKKRFWAASKATYFEHFRRLMYDMALSMSASAYVDLTNLDPKHWARAMFPTEVKCENVDNNTCESFNATIMEARHKCIISLMEHLRLYVAKRMREKKLSGEKWGFEYGPRIQKRLNKSRELASEWNVVFKSDRGYEVEGFDGKKHVVVLNDMSCTCRRWDLTGIPCAHAVCAIQYEGRDAGNYLHMCYSRAHYLKSYSYQLEPIRGEEFWPTVNLPELHPPEIRSLPGRKKKKRRLEEHEKTGKNTSQSKVSDKATRQMRCGWCETLHHNKRGCPKRAYYLALEATQKAQMEQEEAARREEHGADDNQQMDDQEELDNGYDIPMSQPSTQEQATQEDMQKGDMDDRVLWNLTINDASRPPAPPAPASPPRLPVVAAMPPPAPANPSTEHVVSAMPPPASPMSQPPRPVWQPPRPLWQPPRPLWQPPRKVTGLGLYQNSSTGVAILDPGKETQRVISEPVSSESESSITTRKKRSKRKKPVAPTTKIWHY